MARGIEGNEIATPRATLKKTGSSQSAKSGPKQQSIAGFFAKRPAAGPSNVTPAKRAGDSNGAETASKAPRSSADITPVPSSIPAHSSPQTIPGASQQSSVTEGRNKENGAWHLSDLAMRWRLTG